MVKQVKLAKAIHAELTARAGVPPVVHNGHLCVYAPERGIFVPQDPEAVRRLIFSYDGRRLNGEGPLNWAQPPTWPCGEEMLREHAFPEACEEFFRSAMALEAHDEQEG